MRLFASYAHENSADVLQLVEILAAGGHTVLFDQQLLPGQDWKRELGGQIAGCDAFIYALTPLSVNSEWCQWELATAISLQKSVVPVLMAADVALPDSLRRLQYADFKQGASPVAVAKLMGALSSLQKVAPKDSPSVPADPKGIPSRAWENVPHWTNALVPSQHKPSNEAEQILGKFAANRMRGIEGVGGRIIVTNQRFLFEAHKLNIQREPLALSLGEILEVTAANSLGILPNRLIVKCRSGEQHHFVTWSRGRIIELVRQYRPTPSY